MLLGLVLVLIASARNSSVKAQEHVESQAGSASEGQQVGNAGLPTSASYRATQTPVAEHATNQQQTNTDQKLTTYDKLSLVAQYLIFVATLIYAWIANRQLRAIDKSAKAATMSAMAVLQQDRPILVADNVTLVGVEAKPNSTVRDVHVSFDFKNRGSGIGIVTDIQGRLDFKDEFDRDPSFENVLFFFDPLVSAGESTPRLRTPYVYGVVIDDARWHTMEQLEKQLQFRGRIDYTDLARQERYTKFAFGYMPSRDRFYRLADMNEYDAYTENRRKPSEEARGYFARLRRLLKR